MRTKLIAANWKMYKTPEQTTEFFREFLPMVADHTRDDSVAGIARRLLATAPTRFALIAGALVLTVLVIGTNLAQDWEVAGLQLIYAFIYYYLLARLDLNAFSLDRWRGAGQR
jgi:hypothetical protein